MIEQELTDGKNLYEFISKINSYIKEDKDFFKFLIEMSTWFDWTKLGKELLDGDVDKQISMEELNRIKENNKDFFEAIKPRMYGIEYIQTFLASILNFDDALKFYDDYDYVILSDIITTFDQIWKAKNKLKFDGATEHIYNELDKAKKHGIYTEAIKELRDENGNFKIWNEYLKDEKSKWIVNRFFVDYDHSEIKGYFTGGFANLYSLSLRYFNNTTKKVDNDVIKKLLSLYNNNKDDRQLWANYISNSYFDDVIINYCTDNTVDKSVLPKSPYERTIEMYKTFKSINPLKSKFLALLKADMLFKTEHYGTPVQVYSMEEWIKIFDKFSPLLDVNLTDGLVIDNIENNFLEHFVKLYKGEKGFKGAIEKYVDEYGAGEFEDVINWDSLLEDYEDNSDFGEVYDAFITLETIDGTPNTIREMPENKTLILAGYGESDLSIEQLNKLLPELGNDYIPERKLYKYRIGFLFINGYRTLFSRTRLFR
jgi:hypothetical protein